MSARAGTFVMQPGGYKAFIPAPLPPDPSIEYDEELQSLLSKADRDLARLDGITDESAQRRSMGRLDKVFPQGRE